MDPADQLDHLELTKCLQRIGHTPSFAQATRRRNRDHRLPTRRASPRRRVFHSLRAAPHRLPLPHGDCAVNQWGGLHQCGAGRRDQRAATPLPARPSRRAARLPRRGATSRRAGGRSCVRYDAGHARRGAARVPPRRGVRGRRGGSGGGGEAGVRRGLLRGGAWRVSPRVRRGGRGEVDVPRGARVGAPPREWRGGVHALSSIRAAEALPDAGHHPREHSVRAVRRDLQRWRGGVGAAVPRGDPPVMPGARLEGDERRRAHACGGGRAMPLGRAEGEGGARPRAVCIRRRRVPRRYLRRVRRTHRRVVVGRGGVPPAFARCGCCVGDPPAAVLRPSAGGPCCRDAGRRGRGLRAVGEGATRGAPKHASPGVQPSGCSSRHSSSRRDEERRFVRRSRPQPWRD
mmetsp:Transcript_17778/g.42580  ORF Transcript_17778/g.42580 Transcript_17778/m.42580 type:complete len:402 (+) Transcript_17778:1231-2436(+)